MNPLFTFSIAFNSIIKRRRWLHYGRRVIGSFHRLLATHCAHHHFTSLAINRCDLAIKQGDGGKGGKHELPGKLDNAANMCLTWLEWLLKCMQVHVSYINRQVCGIQRQVWTDMQSHSQRGVFDEEGDGALDINKYTAERLVTFLLNVCTVCCCLWVCA